MYVLLDDDLETERERLVTEVSLAERQDAWLNRPPAAPAMHDRLRELDVEIDAARVPFVFQAFGRDLWMELAEDHTDEKGDLDVEAFGPLIIAESAIDPVMTVEQVQRLWKEWSAAETESLYMAAFRVNREVRDIPFISAASDETENSDSNSTTAYPED